MKDKVVSASPAFEKVAVEELSRLRGRIAVLLKNDKTTPEQQERLEKLLGHWEEMSERCLKTVRRASDEGDARERVRRITKWARFAVEGVEAQLAWGGAEKIAGHVKEIEEAIAGYSRRLEALLESGLLKKSEEDYLRYRLAVTISQRKGHFIGYAKGSGYEEGRIHCDIFTQQRIAGPLASLEEAARKRSMLKGVGADYLHNIFDRFSREEAMLVQKEWRKLAPEEIAGELGISEEEVIGLARALGLPTIPESLEWWRMHYSDVAVAGEAQDVTGLLSETKSGIVLEGIAMGCRVYALRIQGGSFGLKKWDLDGEGEIRRDSEGRAEISPSPRVVTAAWLCSFGSGDTRNIGYDEIRFGRSGTIEGISPKKAREVLDFLGLGEDDTYILMVRRPEEIHRDVAEFISRVSEVISKGSAAERTFIFSKGESEEECVRRQSHPLIREEMVQLYLGRKKD